jgi:DNA-directed RNA polymerase sigma subunit (sigma70/sigma32)
VDGLDGMEPALRAVMRDLPEEERRVLLLRFGLDGPPPASQGERSWLIPDAWTLNEIAAATGWTRERVRQLEEAGLRRVRGLKNRTGGDAP